MGSARIGAGPLRVPRRVIVGLATTDRVTVRLRAIARAEHPAPEARGRSVETLPIEETLPNAVGRNEAGRNAVARAVEVTTVLIQIAAA